MKSPRAWLGLLAFVGALTLRAADYPPPHPGDFNLPSFKFQTGDVLPELHMHYITFGSLLKDPGGRALNAVLILHGTTGNCSNFVNPVFAGELFGAGQPLDAATHFIVIVDNIGHGHSSKPSDGLHAHFPRYGYPDMVEAQYELLTQGLGVNHLRLVMGASMGGMHTWLWGATHPDFMDALMPLASLPTQISGRNRVWRRMIIDSIRNDPGWDNGDYSTQPAGLRVALETLYFMGSNPILRWKESPTRAEADAHLDRSIDAAMKTTDANDTMYALDASRDYDPGPGLEKIQAPLYAVNSADDLINPPELGILEREIHRVKHGKAVVLPLSDQTRGHGTHTLAALWKNYLEELLRESAKN